MATTGSPYTLREFYDPMGKFTDLSPEHFFTKVAEGRARVHLRGARGLGYLADHEVILAESVHAMIDIGGECELPIPNDKQNEIAEGVRSRAALTAGRILDYAGVMRERFLRPWPRESELDLAILSARILAAVVHKNVFRRNGSSYTEHTEGVAAILSAAWRAVSSRELPEEGRRSLRIVGYLHDAYEDSIDPEGWYLERSTLASPLVIDEILKRCDVVDREHITRALLLMTRTRGVSGRAPYEQYIARGINRGGRWFVLPKAADNQHNSRIDPDQLYSIADPKAEKFVRKGREYEATRHRLDQAINDQKLSVDDTFVLHAIFRVTIDDVRRERRETRPIDIEGFRE